MALNMKKWFRFGVRGLLLSSMLSLSTTQAAEAGEVWNIGNVQKEASAKASAEALQGIITGLEAFRAAETGGIKARQENLSKAADQMFVAHDSMKGVWARYIETPESKLVVSYQSVSDIAKVSFETWLKGVGEKSPETLGDFYMVGVSSTEKLAIFYKDLAKREDDGAFQDFLNATYPYLQAGAVAAKVIQSEGK